MNIRIANLQDAKEISEIYKFYAENTNISFEYVAPTAQEFEKRIANTLANYPYLVCEDDGKIVGYAYASRYMERVAYDWDAVLSVYIDKEHRNKGYGKALYQAIIKILVAQNIKNVLGCITYGNKKSIEMHEKLGFKVNAIFHNSGYKNGQWLDTTWVEKQIGEYDVPPKAFVPFSEISKDF